VKNSWNDRSKETAYLLNPAFCGRLIYTAIRKYNLVSQQALPFPLVYLILPLVLHKSTREKISSRTKLLVWIQQNPELLIGFAHRAKEMVKITNEAVEFLLQTKVIVIDDDAKLKINTTVKGLSKSRFVDNEIKQCLIRSEYVAKWFANTGKVETIFIGLGVRP
jgi:hypothetical protein